jgi:hypothetical protein
MILNETIGQLGSSIQKEFTVTDKHTPVGNNLKLEEKYL